MSENRANCINGINCLDLEGLPALRAAIGTGEEYHLAFGAKSCDVHVQLRQLIERERAEARLITGESDVRFEQLRNERDRALGERAQLVVQRDVARRERDMARRDADRGWAEAKRKNERQAAHDKLANKLQRGEAVKLERRLRYALHCLEIKGKRIVELRLALQRTERERDEACHDKLENKLQRNEAVKRRIAELEKRIEDMRYEQRWEDERRKRDEAEIPEIPPPLHEDYAGEHGIPHNKSKK